MSAKEKLDKLINTNGRIGDSYSVKEIEILSKVFENQYTYILNRLEVLETIKNSGLLDIVFSENTFVNILLTDCDCINVDYDSAAPDIKLKWEEYEKIVEYIKSEKSIEREKYA